MGTITELAAWRTKRSAEAKLAAMGPPTTLAQVRHRAIVQRLLELRVQLGEARLQAQQETADEAGTTGRE